MFQIPFDVVPNVSCLQPCYQILNISKQFKAKSFISEVFPLYPLQIILIPHSNDSINKLQIVVSAELCPKQIIMLVADDLHGKYDIVGDLTFDEVYNKKEILKTARFKQFNKQFLKLRITGVVKKEENISKQISILGLKLFHQRHENTQYLYNINFCRQYPKDVCHLLECLEYRLKHKIKQKDYQECENLNNLMEKVLVEYELEVKQNVRSKNMIESNVVLQQIKKQYEIKNLAKEFPKDVPSVKRASIVKNQNQKPTGNAEVSAIFEHYIQRITPYYLDLLGSPLQKHNQKAILDLWNAVKHQFRMPLIDQEMVFDLVIYFMNSANNDTFNVIMQVCRAFLNNNYTKTVSTQLSNKLLLLFCESYQSKKDLIGSSAWEATIVEIFPITKQDQYFDIVLNSKHVPDIKKVEILCLLLKTQRIDDYHNIVNYLKQLFEQTKSSKKLVSFKTALESILEILEEKLPTNVIIPLRKQLNMKLEEGYRRNSIPLDTKESFCEYCLIEDPSFSNSDLLNMHFFKHCIYLTKCKQCQQIIEIPKLVQHCLLECQNRKLYNRCGGCGLALREKDMKIHRNSCPQKKGVYCPLCLEDMGEKEELQKHIRGKKCPRNPRD